MSICRTTILETHTKEDLDTMHAEYVQTFKENYPDSELTLNSRIGPTTMISNSVYPNQETIEKTQKVRDEMMGKHKNRVKEATTHVGKAAFKHIS
mgnify:CR=1 FL=1